MWGDNYIENTDIKDTFSTHCYPFPRPSVTVDIVIIKHTRKDLPCKVLLIKRANEPFKDSWAIPGGFLDLNETLLSAAKRELEEETSIRVPNLTSIGVYDSINRDPRGRVITHVFAHIITNKKDYLNVKTSIKAGDDAREAKFFSIDKLPNMAFDHSKILSDTIEKIIN